MFIPPHLRVVQIMENPLILGPEETVWDNLVYGLKVSPSAKSNHLLEERVRKIMTRLGLSSACLTHLTTSGFVGVHGSRLTRADRQLISIGRALIMNPEVIVAHKPMALIEKGRQEKVFELLREFVENRGVEMPPDEPLSYRRKRTVIFSCKNKNEAEKMDLLFVVENGGIAEQESASSSRLKQWGNSVAPKDDQLSDHSLLCTPASGPPLRDDLDLDSPDANESNMSMPIMGDFMEMGTMGLRGIGAQMPLMPSLGSQL